MNADASVARGTVVPTRSRHARPVRRRRKPARLVLGLTGLAILVVLWEAAARALAGVTPLAASMAPVPTFRSLAGLITSGQLTVDTLVSLQRVLVSLIAALVLGIPIGIAVGASRRFDALTGGAFQLLRMISPLSWMPIAVMAFGIGNAPIYFLLTITAVWPIVIRLTLPTPGRRCANGCAATVTLTPRSTERWNA